MKLPSFPRLLLIFLDIVAISVLVHLNRIGVIGGLGYLIDLLGTAILFAFLVKLAREDEEKNQRAPTAKDISLSNFMTLKKRGAGVIFSSFL